jgi:ribosomal protein S8
MLYNLILNLSKLKTGSIYKKSFVIRYNFNNVFITILKFLYKQGFIKSFLIFYSKSDSRNNYINISLNYSSGTNVGVIDSLKIITKPSLSVDLGYSELCRLKKKKVFYFFFTSKGFIYLDTCLKYKIGGKLLFRI